MAYDTGMMTPADIAAVTGNNGNSGFGGWGDSAWIIIFLIFALGGWNNNGFGGGSNGINPNYVTSSDSAFLSRQIDSDTAGIERKLDYVQEQICTSDMTRANQVAGLTDNLFGIQNNMATNFAAVNQGISNNRYENAIATANAQNALQSQIASCCCDARVLALQNTNAIQSDLAGINYNMAANTNMLANTMCNNTRDIIDNANANYRAIHDEIMADRLEEKNDRIAELQNQLNAANLAASQARQNNYLIDQLRPTPEPSYIVPNPFTYNYNGCGCSNGCGSF